MSKKRPILLDRNNCLTVAQSTVWLGLFLALILGVILSLYLLDILVTDDTVIKIPYFQQLTEGKTTNYLLASPRAAGGIKIKSNF